MDNPIETRYYAEGTWTATSALHLGGDETGYSVDMALLRASDGSFFVPGASIAGAARSYLARGSSEPPALKALFGGEMQNRRARQYQSLLTVFDAFTEEGSRPAIHLRDGVRIDPKNGQAEDQSKFNMEVLPSGTRFKFRLLLPLYRKLPFGVAESDVLEQFRLLLAGLKAGEIRLGARTRRGFGEGKVESWSIRKLSTGDANHVLAWLKREWMKGEPVEWKLEPARRAVFSISATLRLKTSLLVRGPGGKIGDPDMAQLAEERESDGRTVWRIVLPGSSIAGALRQRCLRIANTLGLADAEGLVTSMFGRRPKEGERPEMAAGHVEVDEACTNCDEMLVQGRVKIDRFTGGAIDGALFDEAPFYPKDRDSGKMQFRIRLDPRDSQDVNREMGLLMLAFKDLWLGDLPLGGETGVGRGIFLGVSADLTLPDGTEYHFDARDESGGLSQPNPAMATALNAKTTRLREAVHG